METLSHTLTPVLEGEIPKTETKAKTCQDLIFDNLTWEEMLEKALEMFESDSVNIEELQEILEAYMSKYSDWKKYAKWDKYKYTRNLVHEGNGKVNVMLLCWAEGNESSIHDHSDAHCFVKVLQGQLKETKYAWPHDAKEEDGSLKVTEETICKTNEVAYMSDELGLHRMANPSHSERTVSLHFYSPPFSSCQVFDERTGQNFKAPMMFWSKFGEKVRQQKSENKLVLTSTAD